MSFTTDMLRKAFKAGDDKRDAGLTTPEDIERWDDIVFGDDPQWQIMDVYRPKNTQGPLPVIVSIHGGGWTYGDKERYQYYCMSLAQRGFAVVNFTYRVAPEFKWPAGIEDTNLVFSWMMKNPDWFDLSRIYAVGDSAGGHMLTVYSTATINPEYAALLGIEIPSKPDGTPLRINGVGLNCGVYKITLDKNTNPMTRGLMKALLKDGGTPEELRTLNPVPFITKEFPPAYIMTANEDGLAGPPAQKVLTEKLAALGVPFVDRTYGTKENPLQHVFHCNMRSEDGQKCNDDECAFFREI